jgi:hypothetical protein
MKPGVWLLITCTLSCVLAEVNEFCSNREGALAEACRRVSMLGSLGASIACIWMCVVVFAMGAMGGGKMR